MAFAPTVDGLLRVDLVAAGVRLSTGDRRVDLHPRWLRERSVEPGEVDATNRQRLYAPTDVDPGVEVRHCQLADDVLEVEFSDGHRARLDLGSVIRLLGWVPDGEAPPEPEPWLAGPPPIPVFDWAEFGWSRGEGEPATVAAALDAFHGTGFVVFRNVAVEDGNVRRVGDRLGYVVGHNFGAVFDVRAERQPTDLAYTGLELVAHTDQPYRRPPPGIQLLHCLANDAPGGDSTLVDGLAAWLAIGREAPQLSSALHDVEVEFRYDIGTDTVVGTAPIFEVDRFGGFRSIRFNPKLDTPVPTAPAVLDRWYDGRRWLTEWFADPCNRLLFRLGPGDVLCMDNHRILHGRTAFEPGSGSRHLQGCYIERDGPDTLYRLAKRRLRSESGDGPGGNGRRRHDQVGADEVMA